MTTLILCYLRPRSTSTHSLMAFDSLLSHISLSNGLSHMLHTLRLSPSLKHPLNYTGVSSTEIKYDSNPIHTFPEWIYTGHLRMHKTAIVKYLVWQAVDLGFN